MTAPLSGGPATVVRRFGLRVLLALTAVLSAAVALGFLVLSARSSTGATHDFDLRSAAELNDYLSRHRDQIRIWKAITTIGGPATWRVLAALAVVLLSARRRWRPALLIAVVMAGAAALSGVTKLAVNRARPVVQVPVDHAGGASFPSGHALTSFLACGVALVLLLPAVSGAWRVLLVASAVLLVGAVGFSRLILGVHYPTDVVGGWLIATLWLAAVIVILRPLERRLPDGAGR